MSYFVFPKPRDFETFEDIVCDVYSREFANSNLQRYGRRGQRQNGVDIAGFSDNRLVGIQCKNHPEKSIGTQEVDNEVLDSEGFTPNLDEYLIATSASKDSGITKHVLGISGSRKSSGQYPVSIVFWEDICELLLKYPDLVYKHFKKHFPKEELEVINFDESKPTFKTAVWPVKAEELKKTAQDNIGGARKIDPYSLTLGVSTFEDVAFDKLVDLDIQLSEYFTDRYTPEQGFEEIAKLFTEVKKLISDRFYLRQITIQLQSRLTAAFLFGWIFRKVTKHELTMFSGSQIWTTNHLPYVNPKLVEHFPQVIDLDSDEAVLVLNMSRDINQTIDSFVKSLPHNPKAIVSYGIEGYAIKTAAQALSIAIEISRKIKGMVDLWGVSKIHLVGAMPAPLATLIGYHLNAICPIAIYFLSENRKDYKLGGIITNKL